jgi:hypothetical protein
MPGERGLSGRRLLAIVSLLIAPWVLGWFACSEDSRGASDGAASTTPACTLDGGPPVPYAASLFGTFLGPDLSGDICAGGAFAYLERTPGPSILLSQILLSVDASTDTPAGFLRLKSPTNATGGSLALSAGVNEAVPGSYAETCGGVTLCVYLPAPPFVDCGDAAAPTSCPPGCSLIGATYYDTVIHSPVMGPLTCVPTAPENCYAALAAQDCTGSAQTPEGSWTLTLTSVTPYDGQDGGPGTAYVAHGTFTATLIGDDAGLGPVKLSTSF